MSSRLPASLRQLGAGLRAVLVLTAVLGLAYPLAMTGLAQLLFHDNANGSLVTAHGRTVGSDLVGQAFTRPRTKDGQPVTDASGAPVMRADPAFFQSRPSVAGTAGYDPQATGASNLAVYDPELVRAVRQRQAAAVALDRVAPDRIPADALQASGSGLDPHISPAYAAVQVPRVARVRGLPEARVRALVEHRTQHRTLGFLGEPRVNVLLLNLDLDRIAPR